MSARPFNELRKEIAERIVKIEAYLRGEEVERGELWCAVGYFAEGARRDYLMKSRPFSKEQLENCLLRLGVQRIIRISRYSIVLDKDESILQGQERFSREVIFRNKRTDVDTQSFFGLLVTRVLLSTLRGVVTFVLRFRGMTPKAPKADLEKQIHGG